MASQGDPRVLLVMNIVLSFVFSVVVVGGLAFVDVVDFSWRTVAYAAAALMVLTWIVVLR